jgi:hypothetical protein
MGSSPSTITPLRGGKSSMPCAVSRSSPVSMGAAPLSSSGRLQQRPCHECASKKTHRQQSSDQPGAVIVPKGQQPCVHVAESRSSQQRCCTLDYLRDNALHDPVQEMVTVPVCNSIGSDPCPEIWARSIHIHTIVLNHGTRQQA